MTETTGGGASAPSAPMPVDPTRKEIIDRAYALVTAKDDIAAATAAISEAALALMAAKAKIEAGARFDARRGRYLKTVSGTKFYILDPRPDEVKIRDLAHHLALRCRWGASCQKFYSVGRHVLRVQEMIEWVFENAPEWGPFGSVQRSEWPRASAYGLLHDGHEFILGDMPRPIKAMLLGWDAIVGPIDTAIFTAFGLGPMSPEIEACVKWADDFALITEAEILGPDTIMDTLQEQVATPPGCLEAFSMILGDPTCEEVEGMLTNALTLVMQAFGSNRAALIAPEDRPPAPSETKAWTGEVKKLDEEAASTDKWAKLLEEGS